MFDLRGKVALISGGARGQGAACGRLFVKLGGKVILGDVLDNLGREAAREIGPEALFTHLDVTNPGDWAAARDLILSQFGKLDVLVNSAGIFANSGSIESQLLDEYLRVVMINQVGAFLGMQIAIPLLRQANDGGSIINIISTVGVMAAPGAGLAYTSSKFALRGMTKAAAIELGEYGIRVNCLIPGVIDTPMNTESDVALAGSLSIVRRQPIRRMGNAEECAMMAAFLASDAARFCTGGDYAVDGGLSAGHLKA